MLRLGGRSVRCSCTHRDREPETTPTGLQRALYSIDRYVDN